MVKVHGPPAASVFVCRAIIGLSLESRLLTTHHSYL